MGLDSQGKDRGRCKAKNCECEEFLRQEVASKCNSCDHAAGKHEVKESSRQVQRSAGQISCTKCKVPTYKYDEHRICPNCQQKSTCKVSSCGRSVYEDHEYGPFEYCSPDCRDKDLVESGKGLRAIQETLKQLQDDYRDKLLNQ